jgi:Protein of unknown function (DUF2723)
MMRSSKAQLVGGAVVFSVSLVVYAWTLAPTVTLVDSGELIVAARFLGVAHPPGFPLYILLAYLASIVPIGRVAVRVNFASALFAAVAAAVLSLVLEEILITPSDSAPWKDQSKKQPSQKRKKISPGKSHASIEARNGTAFLVVPAVASGLLLAFSRTLWSYATIAEVYTLNTLLILIIFFLVLRWRRRLVEKRYRVANLDPVQTPAIRDPDALLYTAAAIFGLALGVHHVTVGLTLPALAVVVYRTEGLKFFRSRRFAYAALFSVAALLTVYSYLPLAASRSPVLNWGDPRSLQAVWRHISGAQYQTFFSFEPKIVGEHLADFAGLTLREFGPFWLPITLLLAAAGFANAFKYSRTIFWFLALVIACDAAYSVSYDIAEDKDAYYLPSFVSITIAAGLGLHWLLRGNLFGRLVIRRRQVLAVLALLVVPAVTLVANWPFNNRGHYFIARDYIANIQNTIEPNGLLLTLDWQVASPMLYVREVEHSRPDLKIVDVQLLRRSWYFDYLRRAYPDLIERSRDKVDAYLSELKQWEHDPDAYTKSPVLTQRIASAFQEMAQSFVTRQLEIAPVYVTADLIVGREELYRDLIQWLSQQYQAFPRGLVFQLAADRSFHDPGEIHLQTRGLTDATINFDKDDVVNMKVLPIYKIMLVNRGRYLAYFNHHERAVDAFKQALAFDPKLDLARQGLDESLNKLRNSKPAPP